MMVRMPRIALAATATLAIALTAGCGHSMSNLKAYVAKINARKSNRIEPLPKFRTFASFAYEPGDRREPFEPIRHDDAPVHKDNGIRPDMDRPRDPLEKFPLGSLEMLGTLRASGHTYALIHAPDGIVHRAPVGTHAGQNYGEIIKITDTQVALIEIIPDGLGGYEKRPAAIVMSKK